MPTFKELAQRCMDKSTSRLVDTELLYSLIGHMNIEDIRSSDYQRCITELYDNAKLRGAILSAHARFIESVLECALSNNYISEIPELKTRSQASPIQYNRPDEAAIRRLLTHEAISPAGTIIRLAWYSGLLRNEIAFLKWRQVDLDKAQLNLLDRSIPLVPEMLSYLRELMREFACYNSEYVLVSSRGTAPVGEQNVSVIARRVLDRFGLSTVRLNDLRADYIINTLR